MKKITHIHLENYRAYYGNYPPIVLPKGENLLIYGENGSGKSSLYKSLKDFFASANDTGYLFVKNRHQTSVDGYVRLVFSTFDTASKGLVAGSEHLLAFGNSASTHETVAFVKDTDRIKGFLDYRSLLAVYNHKGKNPNLFHLIVFDILGTYVNTSAGAATTFPEKWEELRQKLIKPQITRRDRNHKAALSELPAFQVGVESALKRLFTLANSYLRTYFTEQNIQIEYILQPVNFHYGREKWEWKINSDLRLAVFQNGTKIEDDYSDILMRLAFLPFLCAFIWLLLGVIQPHLRIKYCF